MINLVYISCNLFVNMTFLIIIQRSSWSYCIYNYLCNHGHHSSFEF